MEPWFFFEKNQQFAETVALLFRKTGFVLLGLQSLNQDLYLIGPKSGKMKPGGHHINVLWRLKDRVMIWSLRLNIWLSSFESCWLFLNIKKEIFWQNLSLNKTKFKRYAVYFKNWQFLCVKLRRNLNFSKILYLGI